LAHGLQLALVRNEDFERLYDEHARRLLDFLVYRTGDVPLSEDILADTFERVLSARRPFTRRGSASEKTWLYTVALNRLRDHARRVKVEERALERVEAGSPALGAPALDELSDREAIRHAMGALSEEEREVIALRYGADLTVPEIAKALAVSLTTAEGRVYRALRKLREALEP
jgi:RNA polymerase sigma factor (sigma-70 family)